ncbi:hypothetical protein ElyMa_000511400 [Elysia marginata]|uniref:DUF4201 domain-containing protein n=1 Tax=Elysia marginata TaxID=1093978 RepID=A0AAV4FW47_9GAST|nr:hypothetical protein ElyMa_000511400 [Elysia marginata]
MQNRRKKYSVVTRPGGVPPPFGTNPVVSTPFGPTPLPAGGIAVTPLSTYYEPPSERKTSSEEECTPPAGFRRDMRRGSSPREIMIDIDKVVSHDPGTSASSQLNTPKLRKSSVHSANQYDQPADKIEMRLLVLEESERSEVMHKLVSAFHQKVLTCFDHYKPDLTLSCLRIVIALAGMKPRLKPKTASNESKGKRRGGSMNTKPSNAKKTSVGTTSLPDPFAELDVEEALIRELPNFTVSRLRSTVQQLLRHATLRQDGTLYFAGNSEASIATKSVQYFIWFFDFMDYLQELYSGFVEKVFTPLFKFFHDHALMGSTGRTLSMSSTFSKLSLSSESDSGHFSPDREPTEEGETMEEKIRMRTQAKASLLQLSKNYKDIKALYDTSEIDKVAERLSFVKEQLDYLLDEEDEVDPEIYSEESAKMIEHLDMDFGTENFIRLVPDMLVKLKKSAWLARRWLELDDRRTKDIRQKVEKLSSIEEELSSRVEILQDDINKGERKLEKETDELSRLMEKEGRCDSLTFKSFNIENQIDTMKAKLDKLIAEKDTFAPRLKNIVKSRDISGFHKLKFQYENNKLQRFVTSRKLATLTYQKDLMADDLNLEMLVRPSVIHVSNKLQDECEYLEQALRGKREEVVNIKRALMPVQEDRASLINRLLRQRQGASLSLWQQKRLDKNGELLLYPGEAVYLRSLPVSVGSPSLSRSSRHGSLRETRDLEYLSRQRLLGAFPAGNNRALRTQSPALW